VITNLTKHPKELVPCLRSLPSPASPASIIRPLTGVSSSSQQPRPGALRITEAASDQENRGQLSHLRGKGNDRPPMMPSTDGSAEGGALAPYAAIDRLPSDAAIYATYDC